MDIPWLLTQQRSSEHSST
ncbi:unnamed protein product, partial [Rotaria magnacalcarata]